MTITADHNGFYREGAPFYPLIQEESSPLLDWSNTVLVRLPATLKDDLDWSQEVDLAHQIVASGKYILWELDLALATFTFIPEDRACFFSLLLALEEFTKRVWPIFEHQTFAVALYRGVFNPTLNFPKDLWEPKGDYTLYCTQLLSEYLHRLICCLPDKVLPLSLIDVSATASPARVAQLLSQERFEHLHLALKGAKVPFSGLCWGGEGHPGQGWIGQREQQRGKIICPPSTGVYLPADAHLDGALLEKLDRLFVELERKQTPFRIVSETKLTEQWDGLDELIVPAGGVSVQGKRKLLGFVAAGGSVCEW